MTENDDQIQRLNEEALKSEALRRIAAAKAQFELDDDNDAYMEEYAAALQTLVDYGNIMRETRDEMKEFFFNLSTVDEILDECNKRTREAIEERDRTGNTKAYNIKYAEITVTTAAAIELVIKQEDGS